MGAEVAKAQGVRAAVKNSDLESKVEQAERDAEVGHELMHLSCDAFLLRDIYCKLLVVLMAAVLMAAVMPPPVRSPVDCWQLLPAGLLCCERAKFRVPHGVGCREIERSVSRRCATSYEPRRSMHAKCARRSGCFSKKTGMMSRPLKLKLSPQM